ncbi:hypothetical protein DM01DRAFT_1364552 [Hesseltinella vesiculosa]|uniref:RRM domain-containing protein n=1 Tax=Hesseltinella vesiculosa TaxID=101127 RepID=A0A1X2G5J2_9FUNG|nr:hypothetical protein DM01DRAFT_1364552 [Hesseltinella vesiculosa]
MEGIPPTVTGQPQPMPSYSVVVQPHQYPPIHYYTSGQVSYYPAIAYPKSYPGSPATYPHPLPPHVSPAMHPTSPPISPTYIYSPHLNPHPVVAQGGYQFPPPHPHYPYVSPNLAPAPYLSPPTMMMASQSPHSFPPLHISSPVLTGQPHPASPPMLGLRKHQQQQQRSHAQLPLPRHPAASHPSSPRRSVGSSNSSDHDSPESLVQRSSATRTQNLYVRGLNPDVTDESFYAMCSEFGHVVSSKAILDQKVGMCKGYGFVMYTNEADCQNAIEALNKKGLHTSFARTGNESFGAKLRHLQDETSTNVYISNIPLTMNEQELETILLPHKVTSSRILRDLSTGLSRGVGFARLTDRESAVKIIEDFHGKVLDGVTLPLQVRFADSPAQKRLKHQSIVKRDGALFKAMSIHDFQSITSAISTMSINNTLPATPEMMLGLSPYTDQ